MSFCSAPIAAVRRGHYRAAGFNPIAATDDSREPVVGWGFQLPAVAGVAGVIESGRCAIAVQTLMANGFTIRGRKYDFSGMKQNPKRGPGGQLSALLRLIGPIPFPLPTELTRLAAPRIPLHLRRTRPRAACCASRCAVSVSTTMCRRGCRHAHGPRRRAAGCTPSTHNPGI